MSTSISGAIAEEEASIFFLPIDLSGSCTLGTVGHRLRPSNLDMTGSLQRQNGWGTIHPVPGTIPPFLAREEGHPSKRN
jgi:hypothetical protein